MCVDILKHQNLSFERRKTIDLGYISLYCVVLRYI